MDNPKHHITPPGLSASLGASLHLVASPSLVSLSWGTRHRLKTIHNNLSIDILSTAILSTAILSIALQKTIAGLLHLHVIIALGAILGDRRSIGPSGHHGNISFSIDSPSTLSRLTSDQRVLICRKTGAKVLRFHLIRDGSLPVGLELSDVVVVEITSGTASMSCPGILQPGGIVHAPVEVRHVLLGVVTKVVVILERCEIWAGVGCSSIRDVFAVGEQCEDFLLVVLFEEFPCQWVQQ